MVYDVTNYQQPVNELFVDKETKELMSQWITHETKAQAKNSFKSNNISDEEYDELNKIFDTLHNCEGYPEYKKAFEALCKFCHIRPEGTIIIKHELKKKKDNKNELFVEYSYNNKKVPVPDGRKLYHQSVVDGIKELIPQFRGKSQKGYLYYKPRIYFTIHQALPKISTDYGFKDKLHTYECQKNPKEVFVDPLLNVTFNGAIYVETNTPIPVKELK